LLTKEFNANQEETEFDLNLVEEPDMPDLCHCENPDEELTEEQADAASMPPALMAGQPVSSSDSFIDLLGNQNDDNDGNSKETKITDRAKFVIKGTTKLVLNLTHAQNLIDDVPEDDKNGRTLTQRDKVDATDDDPTQSITEKMKET
jgi:hypothetical protein